MGVKALWIVLLLMICGLQYRIWIGEGSFTQLSVIRQEIDLQKADILQLQQKNDQLYAEVAELKEGLDAIEENARNQLGMVYPQEQFFWLVESH